MVLDSGHIFIHMLGRGTSPGDLCTPKGGEVKVDWEPWPGSKHQIMWTTPHHSRLGGIVDMHYFSQMSWPVSFFVFSQLPNHPHNGLMRPLYQPIHLGVVRHASQLLHTKEFTHLFKDAAYKVHTPITQEPGWGPKHQDASLIQELGSSFSCLIRGHICHYMLHEMVLEHQDIGDLKQFIQLEGHLYASKVYMQEVHWSSGHNWV